ncbi:GMC oxidoreductase [Saccharothrix xinjiangensis]|uniref:Cholesterol oxidase n=1 Tax=Saccharothrix xinjiangensis TaxID=204798 RepID=A0ABV9Y364_9PSEU
MALAATVSRRSLIFGAGSAAVLAATGGTASARVTPVREEHHRAVVVGSGFGGSVAALRLGRAGVRTLVLERGRWWPSGPGVDTFPRFFSPDRRSSWLEPTPVLPFSPPALFQPYTGLVERIRTAGLDVYCGAGVGGGSLVYQGISLKPEAELFHRVLPAGIDHEEMERVFYPRVAAMLRFSPIPDDVLGHVRYTSSRDLLADAARAGTTPVRLPQPMDWDVLRRELAGGLPRWSTEGDHLYGINNGGRFSLDKTYLADAVATGSVTIAPLHLVREVATGTSRRYLLRCDRITTDGEVVERVLVHADAVFLNAGSVNTSKLLVRARATGTLPDLPPDVGNFWSTNGDRGYLRTELLDPSLPHQGGPSVAGYLDRGAPTGPATFFHIPAPLPVETFSALLLGMGLPGGHGRFRHDPATDRVVLDWPPTADLDAQVATDASAARLVGRAGGLALPSHALVPFTAHPLGGAVFEAVCDLHGRVHDHPGLYVTDSALIPGSTGTANPSWTIAALAERCLRHIVAHDADTLF